MFPEIDKLKEAPLPDEKMGTSVEFTGWDWSAGAGYYTQDLKGNGGSYTDPNGGFFYYPTNTVNSKLYLMSGGLGYENGHFRYSANLVFFNFFDSDKRTANLLMAVAWMDVL